MINDKLKTLKKALLYSYQAATATLFDGREFRCLINPDKNKPAYDNKILSIPYKDICLNTEKIGKISEGEVQIGIKPGDVFVWKQTNTHWLVYLQYIEEDAYFRAEIRRCDQQVKVNDISYWVYIRGPIETNIEWSQKSKVEWNSLNYSLVMYITADENTNSYFKRFQTIKILDSRSNTQKTWQIAAVDPYYGDGIIQICLDEFFEDSIADGLKELTQTGGSSTELSNNEEPIPYIEGKTKVSQYSRAKYTIKNIQGGKWLISFDNKIQDLELTSDSINLDIPGKRGIFTLIYRVDGQEDVTLDVTIQSI